MHYIVIGHDTEKQESWMLHGIYTTRRDAENARDRNAYSEINAGRYMYAIVDIAAKEMELFRSLPANPVIQAKALVTDVGVTMFQGDKPHMPVESVRFTNVPMERVHAAIAVLNGDTPHTVVQPYKDIATRNLDALREASGIEIRRTSTATSDGDWGLDTRTEDFTVNELFGNPETMENLECRECGASIINYRRHTTWHNKLLP